MPSNQEDGDCGCHEHKYLLQELDIEEISGSYADQKSVSPKKTTSLCEVLNSLNDGVIKTDRMAPYLLRNALSGYNLGL